MLVLVDLHEDKGVLLGRHLGGVEGVPQVLQPLGDSFADSLVFGLHQLAVVRVVFDGSDEAVSQVAQVGVPDSADSRSEPDTACEQVSDEDVRHAGVVQSAGEVVSVFLGGRCMLYVLVKALDEPGAEDLFDERQVIFGNVQAQGVHLEFQKGHLTHTVANQVKRRQQRRRDLGWQRVHRLDHGNGVGAGVRLDVFGEKSGVEARGGSNSGQCTEKTKCERLVRAGAGLRPTALGVVSPSRWRNRHRIGTNGRTGCAPGCLQSA